MWLLKLFEKVPAGQKFTVAAIVIFAVFYVVTQLLEFGFVEGQWVTKTYVDQADDKHVEQVIVTLDKKMSPVTLDLVIGHIRYWTERRCEPRFQRTVLTEEIWADYLKRFEELKGRPMQGIRECAK